MGVILHQLLRSWFYPPSKRYQQHASARSSHRLVAPSCCPSARGRRSGPVPAGQALCGCHMCVMSVAHRLSRFVPLPWVEAHPQAPVQLVCLLGVGLPPHATAKHDSTTAPPRPADTSRSAPIAGGKVELELMCAGGQDTLPASGKACRARCARRDRPGAPRGRTTATR